MKKILLLTSFALLSRWISKSLEKNENYLAFFNTLKNLIIAFVDILTDDDEDNSTQVSKFFRDNSVTLIAVGAELINFTKSHTTEVKPEEHEPNN